jgi:hypothetical protein
VSNHGVKLPYPDRQEPTAGRCDCGWAIVYGWGAHDDAIAAAEDHIRAAALAEPYVLEEWGGTRYVRPGRSL